LPTGSSRPRWPSCIWSGDPSPPGGSPARSGTASTSPPSLSPGGSRNPCTGLPQNRWVEWEESQVIVRLTACACARPRQGAPLRASPAARGSGLDAGSAQPRSGSCLTMTNPDARHRGRPARSEGQSASEAKAHPVPESATIGAATAK
jgi:hypothetical protein